MDDNSDQGNNHELAKTYWIFGAFGIPAGYVLIKYVSIWIVEMVIGRSCHPAPGSGEEVHSLCLQVLWLYMIYTLYLIGALIVIWSAASEYDGPKVWAILVKLQVGGVILVILGFLADAAAGV